MLHPSKGQKLVGYLCQETGDKTGKVTIISMVKVCLLRLQLVMVVLLFPIMLLQLDGLLVKPTLVLKSSRAYGQIPVSSLEILLHILSIVVKICSLVPQ
jgi:hypothetical protein